MMIRIASIILLIALSSPLQAEDTKAKPRKKYPYLALALSAYPGIPGGQIYNGEYSKAFQMGVVQLVGYGLALNSLAGDWSDGAESGVMLGMVITGCSWLWALHDAPRSAKRINKENGYGYLLEYRSDRVAVVLDPAVWREGKGARLTFYF